MSSTTRNGQSKNKPVSSERRSWLRAVHSIISWWRGYIELQSWALVVYAVIIVATGHLFSTAGLVLVGAAALIVVLYFVDKWLDKYE